ncbi:MAG: hypothetical protein IPG79_17755 [Saprospiraceae bacterium]|nr:hypothetical protein [Saprospiraceae bacterium]
MSVTVMEMVFAPDPQLYVTPPSAVNTVVWPSQTASSPDILATGFGKTVILTGSLS